MSDRRGQDFDRERALFLLNDLADSLERQNGILRLESADETGLEITATQLSAASLGVQMALDALEGRSPQWTATPFDPLPKDLIRINFVDKPDSPTTPVETSAACPLLLAAIVLVLALLGIGAFTVLNWLWAWYLQSL